MLRLSPSSKVSFRALFAGILPLLIFCAAAARAELWPIKSYPFAVGGRILTASGLGIKNVQVTITFPSGEIRTTKSSGFGYYRFAEIPTGGIYIISVAARKYTFSNATQIRSVQDDLQDVDFVADE